MLQTKLFPTPIGIGGSNGRAGWSVSISGSRALVGGFGLIDTGAALILEDDGSGWALKAVLLPSDGSGGDNFGFAVSLSGDRALVGAFAHDVGTNNTGAAYVFDFDGSAWNQTTKLSASDAANGDSLGYSVALDGDRALLGAISDDDGGSSSGSAYVFEFDGSSWSQQAKLTASDAATADVFGFSVSLSGQRALIGAFVADAGGFTNSGAAYVFAFDGSDWTEEAKLVASDADDEDRFGFSVSIDGTRALIGANENDTVAGANAGAAYVFDFDGSSWSETALLLPADPGASDLFGRSVSLSGDRALIGASNDDDSGSNSGSAYLFELDGTWTQRDKLTASDGSNGDEYGYSVSLDGDIALIGAPRVDDQGNDSGAAYVYSIQATSGTTELAKQDAGEGAAGDEFGFSVSIDGDRALVGAYQDDLSGSSSGAAYIFERLGGVWTEVAKLEPQDGSGSDLFGWSVSLSGDRGLIGAPLENEEGAQAGAAYVFSFDGSSWAETAKLLSGDPANAAGDRFGHAVSLDGNRALIGAVEDDGGIGSAYAFEFDGSSWSTSTRLVPNPPVAAQQYGSSVSVSGDRGLIGSIGDSGFGSETGAAYIVDLITTQQVKVSASDGTVGDEFGRSVSLDGDRAMVGAPLAGFGAVYVYDFNGSSWIETVKLTASDGSSQDQFGHSVALDGNRAAIGAYRDSDAATAAGSAYAFLYDGSAWNEELKLTANNASIEDQFGVSIDVSGERILVGANFDDDRGNNSGSAFLFSFNEPPVAQPDYLTGNEDIALAGDVLVDNGSGADSDPDGDSLLVQSAGSFAAGGIGGTVDLATNGSFTYTPPSDLSGIATFDYTIADPSGETDSATVTITVLPVNDQPSFTADDPTAILEDSGSQVITSWAAFDAGATNELQGVLAYTVDNLSNSSLFAVAPAVDSSGNLSFTPADDAFGTSTFDLVVQDDGGTVNGGVDTSEAQTFTITVLPVNDQPSFTADDPTAILEDSGSQVITSWAAFDAGATDELQGVLAYTVDNLSNSSLFAVAPAVDSSGNLSFTPADDASGTSTFDLVVQDDGGTVNGGVDTSEAQTFTITVLPVNDQPSFTADDPTAILEDSGSQVITNWSAFDAGAMNELQGVLVYTVDNLSNSSLFAVAPAVDSSGNLSFTPADDAFGTSTFDLVVQDDGGTVNGGVDTSEAQTFTITVLPVNDAPSFSNLGDVTVFEDASYSDDWAGSIFAGASNEAAQTVSFIVTSNSNPGLFQVSPTVDAGGNLSFTPTADATGSATIEVIAQDDGGVDNGGVNQSAPSTFTIDVIEASDLSVTKTADAEFYEPEQAITYILVVSNTGPSDVIGALVDDPLPDGLDNANWTCVGQGGGSCAASGSSLLDVPVDLPEGSSVTFTLTAAVQAGFTDAIVNTATVSVPVGVTEAEPSNNSASEMIRAAGLFGDRFEGVVED